MRIRRNLAYARFDEVENMGEQVRHSPDEIAARQQYEQELVGILSIF